MKETKQEINGIGEVTFVKSKRAKYARITLKPGGIVRVTVPHLMPVKYAVNFVEEKKQWILNHLEKQEEIAPKTLLFEENTDFKTQNHALEIYRVDSMELKSKITKNRIQVLVPKSMEIKSEEVQEHIRFSIRETWRKEAKEILPLRTKELADNFGLSYVSVTIRNTTSRWGSCSFHNKINFSLHLMKLPVHLRDYVILHELAHTVEKNHQPPFWRFLDTLTQGKAKELDKELKNYSTRHY